MTKVVSATMGPNADVGADILGLITSGMYDTPLAVVREYMQNSADAYDSIGVADGRVDIQTDTAGLRLTITDYGPGLAPDEAIASLLPVARSNKKAEHCRGFRGIGRLSGLAFARSVKFTTRKTGEREAFWVNWDGAELRRQIAEGQVASDAIRRSIDYGLTEADDRPRSFFEVEVSNVARHAARYLLNRNSLRTYISDVCSVPFDGAFPFGREIESFIGEQESLCGLRVYVDGDTSPLTRPFTESFLVSGSQEDACQRIEFIEIPGVDVRGKAAVGWVAHSSYLGAIHKTAGIRGIRARIGNLQVGSESVFDPLFEEERFNRWCIGEVHVLDKRIVPNARRDYFEPNPHLQNLESKLSVHFKRLSAYCRSASKERNERKRLAAELSELSQSLELASSIHIGKDLALEISAKALDTIDELKQAMNSYGDDQELVTQLEQAFCSLVEERKAYDEAETALEQLPQLQAVFRILTERLNSSAQTTNIIEAIMRDLKA